MERSEPTLVPEWLKATPGSSTSNISNTNSSLLSSSSARSGQRNKLAVSSSDHDFRRSTSLVERTSSSLSRRSLSSNGSGSHGKTNLNSSRSYSSSRRNRDKCLDRELDHHEKEGLLDNGYLDSPVFSGIAERAALQRSKSLVARRLTESLSKKGNIDTANSSITTIRNSVSSVGRSSFEREFPSLGTEEKTISPEITRVSSPALITVPQIPLLGSSTVIGGEGWTSCLADVPSRIASNGALHASVNHSAPLSSVLVTSTAGGSLNMAETVAQAPLRARTTPQLSVETQRLEELAIKQSKQLIPMTPSLPKTLASNLSDKSKLKGTRTADISGMPKGITQSPSLLNHPLRSTPRSDVSKPPQVGNFQVLNREKNCLSPTAKEVQNLTNGTRVMSMQGVAPSVNAPKKTSNFLRKSDLKSSEFSLTHCASLDKRPSPQVQDRNDFFNSLRKKAPVNNSTAWQGNHRSTLLSAAEMSNDQNTGAIASDCQAMNSSASGAFLDYSGSGSGSLNGNCEGFFKEPITDHNEDKGENFFCSTVVPEEKEFEFLRSLGWVEDDGEEAITPEEIASFYSKLRKQVTSPEQNLHESMNKVEAAASPEESSSCNYEEA